MDVLTNGEETYGEDKGGGKGKCQHIVDITKAKPGRISHLRAF